MAQCKSCRKVGFFFNVPKYGICIDCLAAIKLNYELILPVIQELTDLAESSNDVDNIISRLDLAIQHTTDLMEYDSYGVYDLSETLNELHNKKQKLIFNRFLSGYEAIVTKTEKNISPDNKTTLLMKFRSELQKYYPLLTDYHNDLNTIRQALEFEIASYGQKSA